MRRLLAAMLLPVVLSACQPADEGDGTQAAGQASEAPAQTALDLQPTGIVIPAQGGFEELTVPFGSNRAATETTLGAVLGEPTQRSAMDECPVGPVMTTSYEGMVLTFQDDAFVGYQARAPYMPGTTRAEMVADPMVSLVDGSSLGEEFTIGEGETLISGLFDGAGDDARIETLWAGANCIFR